MPLMVGNSDRIDMLCNRMERAERAIQELRELILTVEDNSRKTLMVQGETAYSSTGYDFTVSTPKIPVIDAVKEIMDYLDLEIKTIPRAPEIKEKVVLVEKTT